ncbi:nucleotidyltransferase domain-containing protein [Lysinibacillus irui]|uniref:Nucleotidyltransferase domain-containing protein n=1 Tax=Lysinibacillus irui TaxID=2998077 RepID=A0AAJ5UV97_9BACI|nr:nucleotidyltransferase domain-containing protein [Lysinibacillus irui]WDV06882.1 nucleotidyltransferase domain-containing protein [Lysinibacillus irui]
MLDKWKTALETFLKDWQDRDEVIGALVCGSYVTGNPSKRSDIDVHIILAEDVAWRERGNRVINGFLIEYFANPPSQIRRYFLDDFNKRRTMSMVQFKTGRILYDYTGIIKDLKYEAEEWLSKRYKKVNKTVLEIKKYGLWDALDNLKDCYEQDRKDFTFTYHNELANLFTEYCHFLNLEMIPSYQICAYLEDPLYLQKYCKTAFPDDDFKKSFMKAMQEDDAQKKMELFEALVNYVLKKMGGFHIDGWQMKSPIDD